MADWPTSPEWYNPAFINSGKKYTDNDGVTVSDMNAIIEDLLYLKEKGTGGGGGSLIPNGYTVLFVIGGFAYAAYTVTAGKSIDAPEKPTLEGQQFVGWYTSDNDDDDDAERISFPYTPTADTVLYGRTAEQIVLGFTGLSGSSGDLVWTDDAEGLDTYSTEASGIYVNVSSPLDDLFPFNEIEEFEDDYGNTFVKFPKCYIKYITTSNDTVDGIIDGFKISKTQAEDDMFIPACFLDPSDDSNYLDYFALGKYEASRHETNRDDPALYSMPSRDCYTSTTLEIFRVCARSYGNLSNYYRGYQLEDLSMLTLYNFLCMLYYKTANIQRVYGGRTGNGTVSGLESASVTGTCDAITGLNGWNTSTDCVKMLGIENPYGNISKWIDGVVYSTENAHIYVHLLPQNFEKGLTGSLPLGFTRPTTTGYISALSAGTSIATRSFVHAILSSGSASTYVGDLYTYGAEGTYLGVGGSWAGKVAAGLWYMYSNNKSTTKFNTCGGRLAYRPLLYTSN